MNVPVIERNNTAVELLRQGRCSEASIALKLALLQLQVSFRSSAAAAAANASGVADSMDTNSMGNPVQSSELCCRLKESIDNPTSMSTTSPPLQGTRIKFEGTLVTDASDAYLVLYNRAFCLSLDEQRERIISSVILYNCALASHISGVLRGNSQNLINAMTLYKYSFRILEEVTEDEDSTELLLLALFNNMGHASFQLFHLDEAEHYVKCLREEMGISDSNPLGAALPTIDDDDYDFFCFNVAIRIELMGAPAA
jgi:hypothetical protein